MKPSRLRTQAFEFRAEPSDGRTLEGYMAVFNEVTRIDGFEGRFDEVIARGAFKKTLLENVPVLMFDHGRNPTTGTVPIGAIEEIREDKKGLAVRAKLFDNHLVQPVRDAIAGGGITGASIRFKVVRDEWWNDRKPVPLRTIKEVELFELGPVSMPAYTKTSVGVRGTRGGDDHAERERQLREIDLLLLAL